MTVIVAAAVLRVRPGAEVLLTRRKQGAHLEGYWEFPGGKVELGEDPEDAVVRECIEEIDVRVEVIDILEVAYHRYNEKDVLLLFYDCRPVGEVVVVERGVAAHAWVAIESLRDFALPPPDARLVTKLLQGR